MLVVQFSWMDPRIGINGKDLTQSMYLPDILHIMDIYNYDRKPESV